MASIRSIRRMKRVEIVDDERKLGNGIIVTLRKGWSFDPFQDNRVAGADTAAEAEAMVKRADEFRGPFTA